MKVPTQQVINNKLRDGLQAMIRNISIIAIFASVIVTIILYLGPEISLATDLVFKLAVPSIVLAISITLLYELWIQNGRRSACEEDTYQQLLKGYAKKSDNLNYANMQKYLEAEEKRRYEVEYQKYTKVIDRDSSLLKKLQDHPNKQVIDKLRIKWLTKTVHSNIKARDTIVIRLPYRRSEEFDYLRYNLQDIVYKEYTPNDTRKHLTHARLSKYTMILSSTLIGFNLLSIGAGINGNWWEALIMTVLATASLMMAVVSGFSTGYKNIKIISTGVYTTANSTLDRALVYCQQQGLDLYAKPTINIKPIFDPEPEEYLHLDGTEFRNLDNIFTLAAQEVTKNKKI